MDYYYLGAQLPLLFFDKETYMTKERFTDEARKWMSSGDFEILSRADINRVRTPKTRIPGVLKKYIVFEKNIRTDIGNFRKSVKSNQDYKPLSFPLSLIKEGNPLAIEKKLLKLRWDYIEELESGHYFDMEFIALYSLKLQILSRLSVFNKDKGLEKFKELCEVKI